VRRTAKAAERARAEPTDANGTQCDWRLEIPAGGEKQNRNGGVPFCEGARRTGGALRYGAVRCGAVRACSNGAGLFFLFFGAARAVG